MGPVKYKMKKFVSNNLINWEDEEVLQYKKRKRSPSDNNSDDVESEDICEKKKNKKKRRRKKRSDSSTSILDSSKTFSNHENLQFNDSLMTEDVIIKEEFINPYSDDEEINDENFKVEIENSPEEAGSVDGLSIEKLGNSKRNFPEHNDSSSDEGVIDFEVNKSSPKKKKLKNYVFNDGYTHNESADDIDFEEALQHCTNSHEKSQLVERKKIQNKMVELTGGDIALLEKLQIEIPWSVPICHKIETRVSSYPTKLQKEKFSDLGIKFAAGPYNNEETTKIKENWSEFCKSHNIEENPKLFLNFIWDGKAYLNKQQRINFVRYLAKDLEHRPLWSIYERFQRLFSEKQRGNFTSKEDDIIMAFYENSDFSNKNSALASVLNRSRVSIKNRYKILKAEDSKVKFTPRMDQVFLDNLMEVTGKTCISELKSFEPENKHFKEIASKMNINFAKVKRRWELVLKLRLFVEDYRFVQDIREKLITLLSEGKFTDRRDINWKQLATHFENISSSKLYKTFSDLINSYVPEHRQKSFTDIIECLKHSKNHMTNKKLKKYNYEGKKLILKTSK